MRKLTKKIIVAVLSLAMVMGVMSIPTFADPTSTTAVVVVLPDGTDANNVYLQINSSETTGAITCTNTTANPIGWGALYVPTKNGNEYTFTFSGSLGPSDYTSMGIVICKDANAIGGYKYYPQDNESMFNDNAKIWIKVDIVDNGTSTWPSLNATNTDPSAITAAQVMEKIDAIGTVKFPESIGAINEARSAINSYTGDVADITNMAVYTAAVARLAELEEASKGKVTLFVKDDASWGKIGVHMWSGSTPFSTWPGKTADSLTGYEGWYAVEFDVTEVPASFKVTNGVSSGKQSNQIDNIVKGTYWVIVTDNGAALSATAPAGAPTSIPGAEEPTTAAEEPTTPAATTAADNKATTAADNKATTTAANNTTTAADNKTSTAADDKTTTSAADNTTTAADNGGAGAGEAESTTGAGGSSTDVGASDSSVVIFAVLAAVAIMGAAMVFVKKKSQEA